MIVTTLPARKPALDELLDFEPNLPKVHVKVLQDIGSNAAAFLDQPQKDMFGADVLVIEALGLLIGQRHHLSGSIRESFEHVHLLLVGTPVPTPLRVWRADARDENCLATKADDGRVV